MINLAVDDLDGILASCAAHGVEATVAALVATATAFDWCRIAVRLKDPVAWSLSIGPLSTTRDVRPVIFLLAALALGAAWLAASTLAGVASAWRSAALTGEVAKATSVAVGKPSESSAASGH